MPSTWSPSDDNEAYTEAKPRRAKRRKTNTGRAAVAPNRVPGISASLSTILCAFQHGLTIETPREPGAENNGQGDVDQNQSNGFEPTMAGLLPEYLEARQVLWAKSADFTLPEDSKRVGGTEGEREFVRPLSRLEIARIVASTKQHMIWRATSYSKRIALRKLQVQQERRRAGINKSLVLDTPATLTLLDVPPSVPIPRAVLDGLHAIQTTQYEHSFAARVYGHMPQKTPGLISVDWESRAPWMLLMDDVLEHYTLAHPERDQPNQRERPQIPITYVSLQPSHLRQVHDLLARVFWDGIDVSDALRYAPERCTVIATHGHLVVGAAFLSSPQETYITYLAVRAGWENAQIATTMLYHLIALHPHRDITLHVSVNNPAMLLYNRFGFKAEEFITGFYDVYLDTRSRASKNAIRLRLRR